jgi:hypothetical protein
VGNFKANISQRRKEIKTWHERSYDQKMEEIININDDYGDYDDNNNNNNNNNNNKVLLRQRKLNINTEYVLHNQTKTHSLTTEWVTTT